MKYLRVIPGAGKRIAPDFQADVPLAEADTFLGSVLTCLRCGKPMGPVWDAETAQLYMRRHRLQSHAQDPTKSKQRAPREKRGPICTVEGCNRPHKSRGFCDPHYQRFKKYGTAQPDIPLKGSSHAH